MHRHHLHQCEVISDAKTEVLCLDLLIWIGPDIRLKFICTFEDISIIFVNAMSVLPVSHQQIIVGWLLWYTPGLAVVVVTSTVRSTVAIGRCAGAWVCRSGGRLVAHVVLVTDQPRQAINGLTATLANFASLDWGADLIHTGEAQITPEAIVIIAGITQFLPGQTDTTNTVQIRCAGVVILLLAGVTSLLDANLLTEEGLGVADQWGLTGSPLAAGLSLLLLQHAGQALVLAVGISLVQVVLGAAILIIVAMGTNREGFVTSAIAGVLVLPDAILLSGADVEQRRG